MLKKEAWYVLGIAVALALIISGWLLLRKLSPAAAAGSDAVSFEIQPGRGAKTIAAALEERGIIRSKNALLIYATLAGHVRHFQAGLYELSPSSSAKEIMNMLVNGKGREAIVTIPEGASYFDIDEILAARGIIKKGEFVGQVKMQRRPVEGYLFPDTYRFLLNSSSSDILVKMFANFEEKIRPLLPENGTKADEAIILASILEREVQSEEDRKIVAGILLKRIANDMGLHVDATVCYGKRIRNGGGSCYPVTVLDTQTDDPYNTYLHAGWPPGPIGNPGIDAVKAALSPVKSPYWYYLSDPVTKKTIYSKTLEEHEENRFKYLLSR